MALASNQEDASDTTRSEEGGRGRRAPAPAAVREPEGRSRRPTARPRVEVSSLAKSAHPYVTEPQTPSEAPPSRRDKRVAPTVPNMPAQSHRKDRSVPPRAPDPADTRKTQDLPAARPDKRAAPTVPSMIAAKHRKDR